MNPWNTKNYLNLLSLVKAIHGWPLLFSSTWKNKGINVRSLDIMTRSFTQSQDLVHNPTAYWQKLKDKCVFTFCLKELEKSVVQPRSLVFLNFLSLSEAQCREHRTKSAQLLSQGKNGMIWTASQSNQEDGKSCFTISSSAPSANKDANSRQLYW